MTMSARFPRWSGLLVAVALLAGLVGTVPFARRAEAYGSTITLAGHGWGHGRGMGQWGSLGYALDGVPYHYILNWYYGGTSMATRAESNMTVNLTEIENRDLIVTSGSGFSVDRGDDQIKWGLPANSALRVRRTSGGWAVDTANDCGGGGGWTLLKFFVSPPGDATYGPGDTPRITTAYTGDDVYKMLRVCAPSGNIRSYRGALTAFPKSPSGTWAVNTLPMESYLRGVVPRESPASWGDLGGGKGMEALKVQAVAARSYALAEQRTSVWKAYDTVSSQVYGGAGLNGVRTEDPRSDFAIAATAGQIRQMSNGGVARTEFGSSTGGYTAGGQFPAVEDAGDDVCVSQYVCNYNHNWTTQVSVAAIQATYPSIGTLTEVRVTSRNGLGADGGRVTGVTLTGTNGSKSITGQQFYWNFGLKSDWFSVRTINVRRLKGDTRTLTAVVLSKDEYPTADTAGSVVLASASSFADAMVGAPLAIQKNGPLLLTNRDALPSETLSEIQRVLGPSGPVYLLGGTGVISDAVKTQLANAGYTPVRLAGDTRAATAVAVAKFLGNPILLYEVDGQTFADGMATGAAAARRGGAVLFTNGGAQAPETAAYLQQRTNERRFTVGAAATWADPGPEKAFVGNDRYETAVKLALEFYPYPASAGLANGESFSDGLTGAVHAVRSGGPLLLTTADHLSPATRDYFDAANDSSLVRVVIYGGGNAVSTDVFREVSAI